MLWGVPSLYLKLYRVKRVYRHIPISPRMHPLPLVRTLLQLLVDKICCIMLLLAGQHYYYLSLFDGVWNRSSRDSRYDERDGSWNNVLLHYNNYIQGSTSVCAQKLWFIPQMLLLLFFLLCCFNSAASHIILFPCGVGIGKVRGGRIKRFISSPFYSQVTPVEVCGITYSWL